MSWFGSNDSRWDPGNWDGMGDVPLVGDVWKGVFGDSKGVQAAYDKQIAAAKQQSEEMKQFLMGQKGQAQAFYGPLQHMFNSSYGTEGLKPQANTMEQGSGPLSKMYGGGK